MHNAFSWKTKLRSVSWPHDASSMASLQSVCSPSLSIFSSFFLHCIFFSWSWFSPHYGLLHPLNLPTFVGTLNIQIAWLIPRWLGCKWCFAAIDSQSMCFRIQFENTKPHVLVQVEMFRSWHEFLTFSAPPPTYCGRHQHMNIKPLMMCRTWF